MTLESRAERWALFTSLLGMVAFFLADETPLLGALAIVLATTGRSLARSADAGGDTSSGARMPRWALQALVIGAVAYAALSAIRKPEDFVSSIGVLLCSLQVIRWFDRQRAADLRQMLTMSVFTAVAALLTSNSLAVGAALTLYVPLLVWATACYQLAAGHARVAARAPDTPEPPVSARLGRDGRRVTTGATLFAALVAAVVFVALPRNLGADMLGDWSSPSAGGGTTMGFTEKVQLGRSGEVGESQEALMDMLLTDERGRNVGGPDRAVLLRGLVFDEYDAGARAWVRSDLATNNRNARLAPAAFPVSVTRQRGGEVLSQRITIRNKQSDYLFALGRPVAVSMDRETNLLSGNLDNVLVAPGRSGRVTYTVESQIDYSPAPDQATRERMPPLFRQGPIRELTDRVLAGASRTRAPEDRFTADDLAIARVIEKWLRTEFAYSLEMAPPQEGEDPIEMFLFRTKRGHCEYFASAMTAMLRSVGMDARVVGGFRASEYNEIAGQYTVRQSDAHSWVEAQVALGLWVTFDPSPPDGVAAVARRTGGVLGAARHLYDAAEQAWVTWVVGFDHQARTSIFGVPRGNIHAMTGRLERLSRLPAPVLAGRLLRAALVGLIAFALTSVAIGGATALVRALRRRGRAASADAGLDPEAAAFARAQRAQARFYQSLLNRLAALGAAKPDWRAPLDHLATLDARLAPIGPDATALTRLYYELKFGGRLLTDAELAGARERLEALDAAGRAIADRAGPRTGA